MTNTKTTKRLSVVALVLAAACGGAAGEFDDNEDDAAAAKAAKFFTIEHDDRKCPSPKCGGWFITPLKSDARVYVQKLDLARSGLATNERDLVLDAPAEELVLQGKVNTAGTILKVTAAFRGMPGVVPAARDAFYTVRDETQSIACVRAPCDNKVATNAISGASQRYSSHKLDRALKLLVDGSWLSDRILTGNAVVTARVTSTKAADGTTASVLDVSQVFVKLPGDAVCPAYKIMACPTGQVRAFERNASRCLLPVQCVTPGPCSQRVANCADGYTMASWTQVDNACEAHACDPTWSVPPSAE